MTPEAHAYYNFVSEINDLNFQIIENSAVFLHVVFCSA